MSSPIKLLIAPRAANVVLAASHSLFETTFRFTTTVVPISISPEFVSGGRGRTAPSRAEILGGFRLDGLFGLRDLFDHLANCGVGAWAPLFAPGFEPCAVRFEIAEEFLAREHFTPGGEDGFHLLERRPFFAAAFE